MVRREKTTIFLEANEDTTVLQVKVMLEPIVKRSPDDQRLCRHDTKEVLDEKKSLGDSGFKMQSCKAMDPGCIDLMFRVGERIFFSLANEEHMRGVYV